MLQKIQRFGGAMLMPSIIFAFFGLVVGLTSIFKNPNLVGSIATEGTLWYLSLIHILYYRRQANNDL